MGGFSAKYEKLAPASHKVRAVVIPWLKERGIEITEDKVRFQGGVLYLVLHALYKAKVRHQFPELQELLLKKGVECRKVL